MSQVKGQLHYDIMLYDTVLHITNSGAEDLTFGQILNCLLTFSVPLKKNKIKKLLNLHYILYYFMNLGTLGCNLEFDWLVEAYTHNVIM